MHPISLVVLLIGNNGVAKKYIHIIFTCIYLQPHISWKVCPQATLQQAGNKHKMTTPTHLWKERKVNTINLYLYHKIEEETFFWRF
jgi:hypothetical protein